MEGRGGEGDRGVGGTVYVCYLAISCQCVLCTFNVDVVVLLMFISYWR